MIRRATLRIAIASAAAFSCACLGAGPPSSLSSPPDVERRLTALDPAAPLAYFELAEEVAHEFDDDASIDLARRLYILAFELERARSDKATLGPSVCLALADLATSVDERRWLLALAETMDERPGAPRRPAPTATPDQPAAAIGAPFLLAEALGRYRAGEASRSLFSLFERPEMAPLLARHADKLAPSPANSTSAAAAFIRRVQSASICPECQNKRIVRTSSDSQSPGRLCATCGGNPGPKLTPAQVEAQLRVEAELLNAVHTSWAVQILADDAAPLRDVDPDEIAPSFNVDPARPLWRSGQWVAAPARTETP